MVERRYGRRDHLDRPTARRWWITDLNGSETANGRSPYGLQPFGGHRCLITHDTENDDLDVPREEPTPRRVSPRGGAASVHARNCDIARQGLSASHRAHARRRSGGIDRSDVPVEFAVVTWKEGVTISPRTEWRKHSRAARLSRRYTSRHRWRPAVHGSGHDARVFFVRPFRRSVPSASHGISYATPTNPVAYAAPSGTASEAVRRSRSAMTDRVRERAAHAHATRPHR